VIVYGRNPVREAIRGPRRVIRVWATHTAGREPWLSVQSATLAPPAEVQQRCGSAEHQGICAEVSAFRYAEPDALLSLPAPLIVALDQVQDPQNLGAICRTAECAGAAGVVLPERRSAEVTPAVCKASAGAVEHLPVVRARNLAEFLSQAKRAGLWCYGGASAGAVRYDTVDFRGGVVLVLGSEGRGLRPRVAAACDALVSIPLHGQIESLSVSAAAAVLLYAAVGAR
jgi:23S rRNA (guanosine2251-2'-O)-methyltransferase